MKLSRKKIRKLIVEAMLDMDDYREDPLSQKYIVDKFGLFKGDDEAIKKIKSLGMSSGGGFEQAEALGLESPGSSYQDISAASKYITNPNDSRFNHSFLSEITRIIEDSETKLPLEKARNSHSFASFFLENRKPPHYKVLISIGPTEEIFKRWNNIDFEGSKYTHKNHHIETWPEWRQKKGRVEILIGTSQSLGISEGQKDKIYVKLNTKGGSFPEYFDKEKRKLLKAQYPGSNLDAPDWESFWSGRRQIIQLHEDPVESVRMIAYKIFELKETFNEWLDEHEKMMKKMYIFTDEDIDDDYDEYED